MSTIADYVKVLMSTNPIYFDFNIIVHNETLPGFKYCHSSCPSLKDDLLHCNLFDCDLKFGKELDAPERCGLCMKAVAVQTAQEVPEDEGQFEK